MKKPFEFIEGSPIHFGNGEWLALCGSGWLNISNVVDDITCPKCKELLTRRNIEKSVLELIGSRYIHDGVNYASND